MKKVFLAVVLGVLLASTQVFAVDTYKVDSVHSAAGFKVRHLGVSYVSGKFDSFSGKLMFDGDMLTSLEGTIDVNTINTADAKRDGHLKSDDFFSAEKFPNMTFKSTKVTIDGNTIAVVGDLTVRDVTKTVVLQGEFGGFAKMGDVKKTGLTLAGEINRQEFGLSFNKLLETGQAMVGNEVKISLELEANMEAPAPSTESAAPKAEAQK